jgi:hypothetical protein
MRLTRPPHPDEAVGTLGMSSTNRADVPRKILFTATGPADFINGGILQGETIRQQDSGYAARA